MHLRIKLDEVTGLTTYFSCVNQQVMECASWGTTVDAWLRRPIRDCNCLLIAALQLNQLILASLSGGKLSGTSVNQDTTTGLSCGEGPSTLLKATGTPTSWHVSRFVLSALVHTGSFGGPRNKKSLR